MSRLVWSLLIVFCFTLPVQAFGPGLGAIQPRGGQRGTEMAIFLNGVNLSDAQEVVFYSPGFRVSKLEVVNNNQVKATVQIASDCRLGEYSMRLRCATGVTEMRTFWVGALPAVDEKEPNSEFATPQKINLNVTVQGVIDNEDVDYFVIEAKKGQRISVEIEAMRLGNTLFDPFIAILNAKRFELATSDDTALLKQDCCLSILAPEDGNYIVQVRETSYRGNGACQYRLHVGTFPRPTAIVPAGGKLGEEVEVRFLGDPSGEIKQKIKLPTQMPSDGSFGLFCQDAGGISPSWMPFRLGDVGNCIEVEPNDEQAKATKADFPCAFHGVIEKANDFDHFKFSAKKGQVFDVHCYARRLGSPLDPVMYVAALGQGAFVGSDDAIGPDSYFRMTIPNDGEYVLIVHDHLRKGGSDYFYRVEMTPVTPKMQLGVPKTSQFSQERQALAVPKGNRFATLVSANRIDFGGDLTISADQLPAKTKITTETMASNMTVVPVVLEAEADAPLGGTLTAIRAKHVDPKVQIPSTFSQVAEYIISDPGQSIYWSTSVDKAIVAVTEAVPFKISIVEPKVPLVHGGSMNLKVIAERQNGFKGAITIVPLYNPPGVGSASSVVIPEGQNEVLFPINANGGAPVRKWGYVVSGVATVGNGPVWVSSQLATLEISPPYLNLALERAAVEQGKETQMFVKITNTKPFPGHAKIRLLNLPPKVTTPELEITKETKEIAFPIKTETQAPAGIHRNLFCQIVITEQGEPIVHNLGGSELRIDVPIAPMGNQPAPKTATLVPMPNQPMAKRLSRLEQLRLEQEEREKAAQKENPAPKQEPKKNPSFPELFR